MEVTDLGGHAFSVYITNDYLINNSLSPASFGFKDILSALPEKITEPVIEMFAGRSGIIAFIRPSEKRVYYAFPTLDALIGAASCGDDGELWVDRDRYVLAVPGRGNLDDYGKRTVLNREYARCIIKECALSRLRSIFSQNSL